MSQEAKVRASRIATAKLRLASAQQFASRRPGSEATVVINGLVEAAKHLIEELNRPNGETK